MSDGIVVWDWLYYVIGTLPYLWLLVRKPVPLWSVTGVFLTLNFIFVLTPGYYIYRGGISFEEKPEFRFDVYGLLAFQVLAPPLIAGVAWTSRQKLRLHMVPQSSMRSMYVLMLVGTCAYCLFYVGSYWDSLPIGAAFHGDLLSSTLLRSQLTHGVEETNPPWYFGYYRILTKDLLFFLAAPVAVFWSKKRVLVSALLAAFTFFMLIVHIEKSYLFTFAFAMYLAWRKFRRPNPFLLASLLVVSLALAIGASYFLFSDSLSDAVEYIPLRLMAQVGYVSEQLNDLDDYGTLWLRGLDLGALGRVFGIEYIDISRITWERVHASLVQTGLSGSSAGAAVPDLYMICGLFAWPIYVVVLYVHFRVDRMFREACLRSTKGSNLTLEYRIRLSFYLYLVTFCPLVLVGSGLGLFSAAYILQPGLLIVAVALLVLIRVRVLVLQSAQPALATSYGN
jgi:hypothetical protein